MPDNYTVCVIGAMDRLWFHQIIIFSESISLLCPKSIKRPQPTSKSLTYPSSNTSLPPFPDQLISSHSSSLTHPQCDENNDSKDEGEKKEMKQVKERPTRFSLSKSKTRWHSSSPSTQKRPKNIPRYSSAMGRLESCKSLWELELEEVKGFMDLGFIFKREQLSPRMMSVVPGLQRLGGDYKSEQKTKPRFNATACSEVARDDEIEEEEEKRGIMRPYLSEAWLIKRPDSPLLNLRIPRVSAAADMKKHLRFWARTVASEIHQES